MGKFDPSRNNIYQEISGAFSSAVFSAPAFFNGTVYLGSVGGPLQAFTTSGGHLVAAAKTSNSSRIPVRIQASRPMGPATRLSGRWRIRIPQFCMPMTLSA